MVNAANALLSNSVFWSDGYFVYEMGKLMIISSEYDDYTGTVTVKCSDDLTKQEISEYCSEKYGFTPATVVIIDGGVYAYQPLEFFKNKVN